MAIPTMRSRDETVSLAELPDNLKRREVSTPKWLQAPDILDIEKPSLENYSVRYRDLPQADIGDVDITGGQGLKDAYAAYDADMAAYRQKQMDALYDYSQLGKSDPKAYFDRLEKDLDAGKIRQDWVEQQRTSSAYAPVYQQAQKQSKAKAEQEARAAEQRAAIEAENQRAQALENQKRAQASLESDEGGAPSTVVQGTQTTGISGDVGDTESRRRRRGRQLSTYLGI